MCDDYTINIDILYSLILIVIVGSECLCSAELVFIDSATDTIIAESIVLLCHTLLQCTL